jgi:rhamnosyltransferase
MRGPGELAMDEWVGTSSGDPGISGSIGLQHYKLCPEDARVIIPVRNGGARWREAAAALGRAVGRADQVIVIDSDSTDGSDRVAAEQGFILERIDVRTFNHGRTRQEAFARHCSEVPFVIYMTQDAVVNGEESLTNILSAFDASRVGAAYGRQLPQVGAHPIEVHGNDINFPEQGSVRSFADAARFGIKTAYISNSFAAYRAVALRECGGFPSHLILGEDAFVAMRMLLSGWHIAYCADARVSHSHAYSIRDELERFFDYGVMHAQCADLVDRFGNSSDTGWRYLRSELRFIGRTAPWLLPEVGLRTLLKYAGYRLGRHYRHLPNGLRRRLSMTKGFWNA